MEFQLATEKLRSLPVQVVETRGGVIVKRGRVEVKIGGEQAAEAVRLLLEAAHAGATREELCELFAMPERPAVEALIHHFVARGFLMSEDALGPADGGPESALDVFLWHFGLQRGEAARRLNGQRLRLYGVNHVSRQLALSLRAVGAEEARVVDYPLLRNLAFFSEEGDLLADRWPAELGPPLPHEGGTDRLDPESLDCLVATSDFGGAELLREWNEACVLHGLKFFPVLLQDLVGYVGPLVIPGETACFECLRLRQNSHMADPRSGRAAEAAAFEGQAVSGFHSAMVTVLAEVAALELTKFLVLGPPLFRVGTLVEINLLGSEMKARKVLRVPRCPVCSSLNRTPSAALTSSLLAPVAEGGP